MVFHDGLSFLFEGLILNAFSPGIGAFCFIFENLKIFTELAGGKLTLLL